MKGKYGFSIALLVLSNSYSNIHFVIYEEICLTKQLTPMTNADTFIVATFVFPYDILTNLHWLMKQCK